MNAIEIINSLREGDQVVGRKERQSIVCDTLDRLQIVGKKDLFQRNFQAGSNSSSASRAR